MAARAVGLGAGLRCCVVGSGPARSRRVAPGARRNAQTIADIEKAITEADLGLNPSSDGKTIKAKVPKASKEVRAHSLKQLSDAAETVRSARMAHADCVT